jgi:TRAP-type C4-dicarboxylate transport system permease small subunit
MAKTDSSSRTDGAQPIVPDVGQELELFSIPLNWRRWWTILPEIVALTCTGVLPLVVGANVVSRYTDWYRILWAEDVVKVLFLWVVFLGGAIAVKYQAHVRMGMVSDRLERSARAGVLWGQAIRLSPIVVGAILLFLGVRIVEISMRRELPTLQIPSGYFSTIIPVSGALMIFYALRGLRVRSSPGPDSPR